MSYHSWCKASTVLHRVCRGVVSPSSRPKVIFITKQTRGRKQVFSYCRCSNPAFSTYTLMMVSIMWSLSLANRFCVNMPLDFSSNNILTEASLLDTGLGPSFVNMNSPSPTWKEFIKSIKLPQFRTSTSKIVNVEGIGPLFIILGDLRVPTWSDLVQNLAVEVLLRTFFFVVCIL